MEVICLEDRAFWKLVDQVKEHLSGKLNEQPDKWVSDVEAMRLLNIKSRTTLQKLRDEGKIRFSQPQKKIILYDRFSIDEYLEGSAHETF